MKKNYESEIRIKIDDVNKFLKKLENLNAKMIFKYKFNDHIYIPNKPISDWNPNKKTMRIRENISPETQSRILFTENEIISGKNFQFKQSKYPQGKIELFKGDLETAKALLHSWDFHPFFKIEKKDGTLYQVEHPQKFIVALEEVIQVGYSAEIELWGENLNLIEKSFLDIINLLEIPMDNITSNTLPYIVAEHLKLLNML